MITIREGKRGCGYRKAGGLYLVSPGAGQACGLLPIPLTVCPTCGHGIKFARGWTWINVAALVAMNPNGCQMDGGCGSCPLADANIQRAGLLWIGEQFYKTPEAWEKEAREMGVSRRIKAVPRGFVIGETWVAVAHIRAIPSTFSLSGGEVGVSPYATRKAKKEADKVLWTPGIFRLFKPTAVQYVVKGTETDEELADLEKRGITPVRVEKVEETTTPATV